MDYDNLLQKIQNSSHFKTQRSSSVNQNLQKLDSPQPIKPQQLLKKLEEILQLRQQSLTNEKQRKKKMNTCKVDFTERLSQKINIQKQPDNQKWKSDLQNFATEKKERKTAHPNLMSLQPSSQNLFDVFSFDSNSRNPTITARSKKQDSPSKKGRANSIVEGYKQIERDKGTLIKLNQQLQIQNNHLNEQLRFEQNQNTKLNLLMIRQLKEQQKQLESKDKENEEIMRSLKSQLDMLRPEYYRQQEQLAVLEKQLFGYQTIEKDMKELESMLPQLSTFTTLFAEQNSQIQELSDLVSLENNIIDKILNKKDFPLNNLLIGREPKKQKQYNNDLPFESSQLLDNLIKLVRIQVNTLTERFIHELLA